MSADIDRDTQWARACKQIIDKCVDPSMYAAAMEMLRAAELAARATPSPAPIQQAQQDSCNSALRAEPAGQHDASTALLAEFLAVDDLRIWLAAHEYADHVWWWKKKKAEYDRREPAVWEAVRAMLAPVEQSSIPGAARQGGDTSPSENSLAPTVKASQ